MAVFKEVYEEYGRPVYRFLLSLTGDRDLAEELLQETFYQAFLHIDQFEGRCSVFTWLCQIGKNAWLKECRRTKKLETGNLSVYIQKEEGGSPEEQIIKKDEYRRVREAVFHLEEPYQEVFIMHVFGELKLKEIADLKGKTESWARVTFYRAKAKIIQEVGE
ncbi:MAG: sigma-70 family RNA polymerase sigma factor [Lachnospiraceae bacterium]|nr:sigma-70 family RNA polymerase sigma factor [Lachnospiraceae bacterium]